jgi:hypothetical protein
MSAFEQKARARARRAHASARRAHASARHARRLTESAARALAVVVPAQVEAPDRDWQYLLFAAEPYETIAFKVPNKEIDKDPSKFQTTWDADGKTFALQLFFKL